VQNPASIKRMIGVLMTLLSQKIKSPSDFLDHSRAVKTASKKRVPAALWRLGTRSIQARAAWHHRFDVTSKV
jgi:hypothetical protein